MIQLKDSEHVVRRYSLLILLLLLLTTAALHSSNWRPVKTVRETVPEPGSVKVPAGVWVVGDFEVLYPAGGWPSVQSQTHPVLEVEGWQAAVGPEVSIIRTELFLDGKLIQPISGYPVKRPDIAEMYDRIDFFLAGWHVALPLEHLGSGTHFLALQLKLSNGQVAEVKRLELR